jgi:hypothetical protein
MKSHRKSIIGIPYSHAKPRGDVDAPGRWTAAVKDQTKDMPKIVRPCVVRVTFRLPPDKFTKDLPFGNDLDNLLKRFFDALIETVFSTAAGKDSVVVSIEATKVKVATEGDAGAELEIIEIYKDEDA